jgi:ceramide glucosyltransferase
VIYIVGFCLLLAFTNILSVFIASARFQRSSFPNRSHHAHRAVSIVRPLCGNEPFLEQTLESGFKLEHAPYELIFCVASENDSVISLVDRLIEKYPHVPARILIGNDPISENPKLNNCVKGWHAATYEWTILADSNVVMPADYIDRLFSAWQPNTGLVCSTPIGSRPIGFWAEVECCFLNQLQARWQYVGETFGLGFAQGKTMLWNRTFLNSRGGIERLGSDMAEDAAATKLVRKSGLRVHLVNTPFEQPLGHRTLSEVWARQKRWARLRRVTFPLFFAPELLTSAAMPWLVGVIALVSNDLAIGTMMMLAGVMWYACEAWLAYQNRWFLSWRTPLAALARDFLIPFIWLGAWMNTKTIWRGNRMNIELKRDIQLTFPGTLG